MINEAKAANAGRSIPKPKAPAVQSQLEEADHAATVLARRLDFARADRDAFIRDNHDRLIELLLKTRDEEADQLSRAAKAALKHLLAIFKVEDDGRALERSHAPPVEENRSDPASLTMIGTVGGVQGTRRQSSAGPIRGELESVLRLLISYGPAVEVGPSGAEEAKKPRPPFGGRRPARPGFPGRGNVFSFQVFSGFREASTRLVQRHGVHSP